MKENIHPKYGKAKVICACGNTFTVGSTRPEIYTEICSACHPFFTGQKKLVDSTGRVERFARIMEKAKVRRAEVLKSGKTKRRLQQKKKTESKKDK